MFFFAKSADAQVFLPLVTALHAAETVVQTVSIKHCDHSSVLGCIIFQPILVNERQFFQKICCQSVLAHSAVFFPTNCFKFAVVFLYLYFE